MTITFEESNKIGDPGSISGAIVVDSNTYFTSFYGNNYYRFDVAFDKADTISGGNTVTYTVSNVEYQSANNSTFVTVTKIANNVLRFEQVATPFDNELYYFIEGNTIITLTEAQTNTIDRANKPRMIEWSYPGDPKYKLVDHTIKIWWSSSSNNTGTETDTLNQYLYWNLTSALATFTTSVNQEFSY